MRKWFINKLVHKLYKGITAEDVLEVMANNAVRYRGQILKDADIKKLGMQAREFQSSDLWILLMGDVRYVAERKAIQRSTKWEDVLFAKAALWVIAVIEEKLEELSKL